MDLEKTRRLIDTINDIKTLLEEIVNTYIGEGYKISEIPQSIHNIANKYGYNLIDLV